MLADALPQSVPRFAKLLLAARHLRPRLRENCQMCLNAVSVIDDRIADFRQEGGQLFDRIGELGREAPRFRRGSGAIGPGSRASGNSRASLASVLGWCSPRARLYVGSCSMNHVRKSRRTRRSVSYTHLTLPTSDLV